MGEGVGRRRTVGADELPGGRREPLLRTSGVGVELDAVAAQPVDGDLAQVDLGRRASEAPREYLARFEAGLGGGRGPAERLTTLFERARFSPHAIDERLRADALDALSALRAELEATP